MILRFIFVSIFLPFLDLYVRLFVAGEKLYRRYTGKEKPDVPDHLRDWQE